MASVFKLRTITLLFTLDALINLFAMYSDFFGGIHPYPHLITFYTKHRHGDLIPHHKGLTHSASQNQHHNLLEQLLGWAQNGLSSNQIPTASIDHTAT